MMDTFVKTPLPDVKSVAPPEIPATFADVPAIWLAQQALRLLGNEETLYALVHADDGVIWGRVEGEAIVTPTPSALVPSLRSKTVQQCRVFGSKGELFIWREGEGRWRGRALVDEGGAYSTIAEDQVLWGTRAQPSDDGFTLMLEPGEGFRHIVPLSITQADLRDNKRVLLTVCHYLSEDAEGQVRTVYSRLKGLKVGKVP